MIWRGFISVHLIGRIRHGPDGGVFLPQAESLAVPLRTTPNVTSTFKLTSMSNGKCYKNLYPYGIEKNIRCICCFMVGPNGDDCSSPFHPRREIRGDLDLPRNQRNSEVEIQNPAISSSLFNTRIPATILIPISRVD